MSSLPLAHGHSLLERIPFFP
jgi:hypothetical protein